MIQKPAFDLTYYGRNRYHSGQRVQPIEIFVWHATAGSFAGDIGALSGASGREVSCPYYIARTGTIYKFLDDNIAAWHAGKSWWNGRYFCNQFSLGVEHENDNVGQAYTDPQIEASAHLAAWLFQEYPLPRDRLVTHAQISGLAVKQYGPKAYQGKTDPVGFPWTAFWEEVDRLMAGENEVSDWAKEAQIWVKAQGISTGERPKDSVTREEAWVMLHRLAKAVAAGSRPS